MNGQICPIDKMERLLVATDGTEASQGAVATALELAKNCSAGSVEILAVAVVLSDLEYEGAAPFVIAQAEKDMEQRLETVKALAGEAGSPCEVVVQREAEPSVAIVREAENNHADMIVMGTHGRTGFKRLLAGSVTAEVIGRAPCRVLVIPPYGKVDFGTVLAATDGSKHGEAAMKEAVAIAKLCGSHLIVVSAVASPDEAPAAGENIRRALEFAEDQGIGIEGMVLRGDAGKVIVEAAVQKDAGLIVMGSHGRTGLMTLFMGGVTEFVLSHGNIPVLVARVR